MAEAFTVNAHGETLTLTDPAQITERCSFMAALALASPEQFDAAVDASRVETPKPEPETQSTKATESVEKADTKTETKPLKVTAEIIKQEQEVEALLNTLASSPSAEETSIPAAKEQTPLIVQSPQEQQAIIELHSENEAKATPIAMPEVNTEHEPAVIRPEIIENIQKIVPQQAPVEQVTITATKETPEIMDSPEPTTTNRVEFTEEVTAEEPEITPIETVFQEVIANESEEIAPVSPQIMKDLEIMETVETTEAVLNPDLPATLEAFVEELAPAPLETEIATIETVADTEKFVMPEVQQKVEAVAEIVTTIKEQLADIVTIEQESNQPLEQVPPLLIETVVELLIESGYEQEQAEEIVQTYIAKHDVRSFIALTQKLCDQLEVVAPAMPQHDEHEFLRLPIKPRATGDDTRDHLVPELFRLVRTFGYKSMVVPDIA